MKSTILALCLLFYHSLLLAQMENALLTYNKNINASGSVIKQVLENNLLEDQLSSSDSAFIAAMYTKSNALLIKKENHFGRELYQFLHDTVYVKRFMDTSALIPSKFEFYHNKNVRGKDYVLMARWDDRLFYHWNTTYEFVIDTTDVIKQGRVKAHKMTITEKRSTFLGDMILVSELYVDPTFPLSFNYYPFLELKKDIGIQGLIVSAKSYFMESPELYETYLLETFEIGDQDQKLIPNFDFNVTK